MEALTNIINTLSSEQQIRLRQFQEAGFNLREFAQVAKISVIDAAVCVSDPLMQAALDAFDVISTQSFERAAASARSTVLVTLRSALAATSDLIEARRISTLILRCAGPRPRVPKAKGTESTTEEDPGEPGFEASPSAHPTPSISPQISHASAMPPQPNQNSNRPANPAPSPALNSAASPRREGNQPRR